jgi:ferric iron reductase protein FhuF
MALWAPIPPGDRAAIDDVATEAVRYLLDGAMARHLIPLMSALRTTIRMPERLFWGNAAASAARAFLLLQRYVGAGAMSFVDCFFELAPEPMRHLGGFVDIEHGDRHGWFWERVNCCLYDRLPGRNPCVDCSMVPSATLRARFAATLELWAGDTPT